MNTTTPTAYGNASTSRAAKASGTAVQANDGATRVSAVQPSVRMLTHTVGHHERPRTRGRAAYTAIRQAAPARISTPGVPRPCRLT